MAAALTGAGGSLGSALSDLMADTLTKHQAATAAGVAAQKDATITGIMEKLEAELHGAVTGFLTRLATEEHLPPELQALVSAGAGPTHQADLFIQLIVGGIGGALMIPAFAAPMWQGYLNSLNAQYRAVPLSPPQLAEAVTREIIGFGAAADEAAMSGMDEPRFETLVTMTGEPPSPTELLTARRRGIIDDNDVARGIHQGHLRNEWIPMIQALQFFPMTIGDAVNAAVEGHIAYDEAKAIAVQNGLLAAHFDVLYQAGGQPPGVNDIGDLLNRGIWTMPQAKAAMRESRTKPKYEDDVLSLREALPPREAIVLMIERGVIDQPTAVRKFMALGYNTENATFLAQEALNRKLGTEKDLTKAEITNLYADGLIDRAKALELVAHLGYDATESEFIMDLVDTAIEHQARNAARNRVHSLYVAYRLTQSEASAQLDLLGIRTDVRDHLITIWTHERQANTKDLTKAEIISGYKAAMFTRDETLTRLVNIGYSVLDATFLTDLAIPPNTGGL